MYCKHCGNPLNDLAEFCSKCGSPISDASVNTTNDAVSSKRKKKPLLIIIPIAVIILVFCITKLVPKSIEVGDYQFTVPAGFSRGTIGENYFLLSKDNNCKVNFLYTDTDYEDAYSYLHSYEYTGGGELIDSFYMNKGNDMEFFKGGGDYWGKNFCFVDDGKAYFFIMRPMSDDDGLDSISEEHISAIKSMIINAKKK